MIKEIRSSNMEQDNRITVIINSKNSEDVRETNVRRRCLNVSQMSVGLKKGGKCAYELE